MGVESKTRGSERAVAEKRLIARSELSLAGRCSSFAFAPIKRVVLSTCHSNDRSSLARLSPCPFMQHPLRPPQDREGLLSSHSAEGEVRLGDAAGQAHMAGRCRAVTGAQVIWSIAIFLTSGPVEQRGYSPNRNDNRKKAIMGCSLGPCMMDTQIG